MSCTVLLMPSSLQYIVYSSSLPWFQLPWFLFLLPLIKLLICFVHYSSHLCLVPLHAGPELSYKRLSCQLTFHPISRADPTEMWAQNQTLQIDWFYESSTLTPDHVELINISRCSEPPGWLLFSPPLSCWIPLRGNKNNRAARANFTLDEGLQ